MGTASYLVFRGAGSNAAPHLVPCGAAQVSELDGAQREREQLVQRIFAAPEWAGQDPLLSLLHAERDLQAQAAQVGCSSVLGCCILA